MLAALWSASGCTHADDAPDERSRLDADVISSAQFEAGFESVLTTIRGRVAAMRADLSMP